MCGNQALITSVLFEKKSETFILLGILAAIVIVLGVYHYFSLKVAISASYSIIGLLVPLILIRTNGSRWAGLNIIRYIKQTWCRKIFLIIFFLSIFFLNYSKNILLVLGVLIPVGYGAVYIQYLNGKKPTAYLIIQVVSLLFLIAYSKFTTTTFYIGRMDLIKHTRFTNQIVRSGSPNVINSNYSEFFGLHVISGYLSQITALPTHDAIIILGIVSFGSVLIPVYKFTRYYTLDENISLITILLLSASATFPFYATYFFPQSLAVVFFFFLLYLSVSAVNRERFELSIVAVLIASGLVLTHHFTFLLFLPIISVILVSNVVKEKMGIDTNRRTMNWIILAVPFMMAFYYWGNSGGEFFGALFAIGGSVIETFFTSGVSTSNSGSSVILLGASPIDDTLSDSILWLLSTSGIYNILLVALLALGCSSMLSDDQSFTTHLPIVILGMGGAILLLATPISVKSASRMALPLSIFMFMICALGLHWISETQESSRPILCVIVVLVFCASGPLVFVEDTQNFRDSTDPRQGSISEQEFVQLDATSQFINKYQINQISSFLVMTKMLNYFSVEKTTQPAIDEDQIVTNNTFLINSKWSNYRLRYDQPNSPYLLYVRISEDTIKNKTTNNNRIYYSGIISLVEN
jgi:hypothetical protein